jgi:hypothetical protein
MEGKIVSWSTFTWKHQTQRISINEHRTGDFRAKQLMVRQKTVEMLNFYKRFRYQPGPHQEL